MNMTYHSSAATKAQSKRHARFPVIPFYGIMTLLAVAVSATIFGTTTGIGTVKDSFGKPIAIRDIIITAIDNNAVQVVDAHTSQIIQTYENGEGGFVRGSMRALKRVRASSDAANTQPYRIIRWENGAVSLSDTVTGQRYYLNAFGPDNAAAFAALLDADINKKTTAVQTASN